MLTVKHINPDLRLSVALALTFAAEALPIFEAGSDSILPKHSLILIMEWLQGKITSKECDSLVRLNAIVRTKLKTEEICVVTAIGYIINMVTNNTNDYIYFSAVLAVANAAEAICHHPRKPYRAAIYIHDKLVQLLPLILEYKIENQQRFNYSEEVFEYLSESDKDKFLFNLDVLS